jgi:hypothetical protein
VTSRRVPWYSRWSPGTPASRPVALAPASGNGWQSRRRSPAIGRPRVPISQTAPTNLDANVSCSGRARPGVNLFYLAGACLVAAQLVGIYGLITRKADFIFALLMVALLAGAVAFASVEAYHRIH